MKLFFEMCCRKTPISPPKKTPPDCKKRPQLSFPDGKNSWFPSTFLERFPEKFELQTCETKKSSRNQMLVANKTHFGCRQDKHSWVLQSNKKLSSGEPYPLQSENTSNVLNSTSSAQFGGREIAMTHRFPNSPLSFRYHDDESSRSDQSRPLHHEGPASSTIC